MSRIEDEVCKKIQQRAEVGKSKYGVTMETAPLSRLEWLIHAQEEAMDLAVYLQKLIEMEGGSKSAFSIVGGTRAAAFPSDWTKKEESE
tara:strand:- start:31 stop:297 length:267 start_codon:yes stop_codon:yes gene_type:complete